jgi:hypothetical protein
VNDDVLYGHGVRGRNSNILGRRWFEELNVILWMMLVFSLQKIMCCM